MAVTDIAYANGSLDGFDNLKDALKEGDAKKMADEPTFSPTVKRASVPWTVFFPTIRHFQA
jgi:hypothetical protein